MVVILCCKQGGLIMKISAINVSNLYSMRQNHNFKGIFKSKGESHDYYEYRGCPSGSSYDGEYQGYDDSKSYIYYPFADESKEKIQKVLRENNYTNYYSPDSTGGYGGSDSCSTELGKTLPFTEKEWNRMSKKEQDRIRAILD